jgi:hypothetical protein
MPGGWTDLRSVAKVDSVRASVNCRQAMRKRQAPEGQGSLFEAGGSTVQARRKAAPTEGDAKSAWRMPEVGGSTSAEIRVEWRKRLSPAQVTRAEAELNSLAARLNKLGFGTVHVVRAFVRRRKGTRSA